MTENWNLHGVYWLLRNASKSGDFEDDEYQPIPTEGDAEFIANAPTLYAELVAARARIAELEAALRNLLEITEDESDRPAVRIARLALQGDKPCP
jgi:hypothetical protein